MSVDAPLTNKLHRVYIYYSKCPCECQIYKSKRCILDHMLLLLPYMSLGMHIKIILGQRKTTSFFLSKLVEF